MDQSTPPELLAHVPKQNSQQTYVVDQAAPGRCFIAGGGEYLR
jgi:hypothetical protein